MYRDWNSKLRRSPRVNKGKGRQEAASGSKGMREKHRGADQADKNNRNGNGKNGQRRDDRNTRSDNGDGTGKTRANRERKRG